MRTQFRVYSYMHKFVFKKKNIEYAALRVPHFNHVVKLDIILIGNGFHKGGCHAAALHAVR